MRCGSKHDSSWVHRGPMCLIHREWPCEWILPSSGKICVLEQALVTAVAIRTPLHLEYQPAGSPKQMKFTFGTFDPLISDHGKFGTVYQMAAKDSDLALAMVSLMLHFGWTLVRLFITEDNYGMWFLSELREEMGKSRICFAFENMITYNAFIDYSDDLSKDLGNCSYNATLHWLLRHIFDMTMSEDGYNIYNAVYALAYALHQMFLRHMEEPPVHNGQRRAFLYSQLHPFLKKIQFTNPVGEQVVLNEERKLEAQYDIMSFWNFPEGLEERVKVGKISPSRPHGQQLILFENLIEWPIGITKTPQSVCTESCGLGFRKASLEGNATCCFDCIRCSENDISNATDMKQYVRCADHQFANTQRNRCLMKTESFLAYEDPLGMALVCTALCCSVLTAAVLGVFIKHQDTPIVKANNRALSYILLISLTCYFLCSLLFLDCPYTATCILQHSTFAVVFTVAVSTVLAKTINVVLAFTLTAPRRSVRPWLMSRAPNLIIPIFSLIQVTLCGLWLGISPPFVDTDANSEHGHVIILCNMGSLTAFYCVLGYLGALALASFMAFLVRNLPDTFNEDKFLTFSMLVFCSVLLTFLFVYHCTKGKIMVAVEVFSILASSGGLLSCIFVPNCYILLIRPERNSLHRFR
ncbi:PREDICTED: vomeronasal type-2 receptor 116-like [Dipodomys ordii]|uniref:Vomeronasal type-2 receptor 116-like n=1 Tax=Dipodomys ordii TaxID=10020 RepID=A0A1S3GRP1_DIPOR|nr:PREDICTED: vomeronasal type-2 receptor 116-like [Dipodomys ordii]